MWETMCEIIRILLLFDPFWDSWKLKQLMLKPMNVKDSVDGRNPAPPGMYKTL